MCIALVGLCVVGVGDCWNMLLHVRDNTYVLASRVVLGQKVFFYGSKWRCDFIFTRWSIGDVLIISGFSIFVVGMVWTLYKVLRGKNEKAC